MNASLPLRPESPVDVDREGARFGSDVIAETLRALDVPFVALNPGASFRGLHDSLVNFLGNEKPSMLLCLHEEHAVAIAHGYAKVTGRPLVVIVHSNVGLFHATMAIFNAWCDRMPVIVLGATGPVDAVLRRPWIDWIHTARDQGAIVRGYVKWDDQPASPGAAREALLRAAWLATTAPQAPVYVNFDAHLQEAPLAAQLPPLDAARFQPPVATAPDPAALARAVDLLCAAEKPLILMGRVTRDVDAWHARVQLAERLGARVLTDLKVAAAFPTDHELHAATASVLTSADMAAQIAASDVILSLDWVDLAGTLKVAFGSEVTAKIIQVSLDHVLHNGWSMDHQGLPPVDVFVAATPEAVVPALLAALGEAEGVRLKPDLQGSARESGDVRLKPDLQGSARESGGVRLKPDLQGSARGSGDVRLKPDLHEAGDVGLKRDPHRAGAGEAKPTTDSIAFALRAVLGARAISLVHLPLSWNGAAWPLRHPLDYLGSDGGGGIGGGPGIAVGAALALRDSGRLAIAVCGDGDYLMGVTALWTATHYGIPLLLVIANNKSFYNDEVHQERVARMRDRPVANKWIGQRMDDPAIDLAQMGEAQGAVGIGPVTRVADLADAFGKAIAAVDSGRVAVVDVRVEGGYTPAMTAALTPGKSRDG